MKQEKHKNLSLEEIKKLTLDDFDNDNVWESINVLSDIDIESLIDLWDEEINSLLVKTILNREEEKVRHKLFLAFQEDKELFANVLLANKDTTWDFIRTIFD